MKTVKFIYLTVLLSIGLITINSCSSDDDCTAKTWYQDADGDGFGNLSVTKSSCNQPADYVLNSDDIDDGNANINPNTVWQGSTMVFSKANNADWTLEANQDRITSNVWITRANNQGIFNIATETGYQHFISPADTEWAFGTTASAGSLSYQNWEDLSGSNPPSLVDQDLVLHLITDNIYIDLKFTSWGSGGAGGGFSYERSTMN